MIVFVERLRLLSRRLWDRCAVQIRQLVSKQELFNACILLFTLVHNITVELPNQVHTSTNILFLGRT